MSDKLYTVSLKGQLPHQPWVVINADTADDLADALESLIEGRPADGGLTLLQAIADTNATYQATANVANPYAPVGSGEPAQVAQAATPAPARQDTQPAQGGSSYARRKASAGTGGRGGQSERLKPGVVPEPCQHGARTYREGNGARGFWSAYFCPSPKNTPGQCEPLWVDND